MSSITIQPILYELKYDNKHEKYIDNLYFSIPTEGLKCPCREKSKTVFFTKTSFKNHIKTKSHQKWIININETSENNEVYKYKYEELKKLLREKDILLNQIDIKNQQLQQQICNLSTILSEKQSKIIELERKNINPDNLTSNNIHTTETIHPHSQFNSFNLPMLREINNVERSFETDTHERSTNYDFYDSIYDVN